jgi:hypothetical protein
MLTPVHFLSRSEFFLTLICFCIINISLVFKFPSIKSSSADPDSSSLDPEQGLLLTPNSAKRLDFFMNNI